MAARKTRRTKRKRKTTRRKRRTHSTRLTKRAVTTMLKGAATLDRNIDTASVGLARAKGLLSSAAEEYMSGSKKKAARLIKQASGLYSKCGLTLNKKAPR